MKYRTGFVSNSSSSSFALIGISLPTVSDLKPSDIKKNIYVIGTWYGDGTDVFRVENADMLKFIKENPHHFKHVFIKARMVYESSPLTCTRMDLPSKSFTIFAGNCDFHSSNCLADLQHRYGE